jgi:hypothetical protein
MKKLIQRWLGIDQLIGVPETLNKLETSVNEIKQSTLPIVEKAKDVDQRKNSSVPWVDINTADFDLSTGFKIDLDWNDAFIAYLRQNGIKGQTDEIIVQKWLAFLYEDIVGRIEQDSVKESVATDQKPGDFE